MTRHAKTARPIEEAAAVLTDHHPMTLRQVYYQLVSRQVLKNNRSQYQALSKALVTARREGLIPWEWIEDRLRRPRRVSMWDDLPDFAIAGLILLGLSLFGILHMARCPEYRRPPRRPSQEVYLLENRIGTRRRDAAR